MKRVRKNLSLIAVGLLFVSATVFTSCGNLGSKVENLISGDQTENSSENLEQFDKTVFNYRLPDTYSITIKINTFADPEYITFVKANEGILFEDSVYYFYDKGTIGFFNYDKQSKNVQFDTLVEIDKLGNLEELLSAAALIYLGNYKLYSSDLFRKVGSETVLGRPCTKYQYGILGINSYYIIDDEYNICVKFYIETPDGSGSWEVTEFNTSNVKLPPATPDYKDQINDYIAKLTKAYVGTWKEFFYDESTGGVNPVENGETIVISDKLTMTYNKTDYKLSILDTALVVYDTKGIDVLYVLGFKEDDDQCLIFQDCKSESEEYKVFRKS